MNFFSDPSWKRAFVWAVLLHIVLLTGPIVISKYWPIKPKSPSIVTINLFDVAPLPKKKVIKPKPHPVVVKKKKKVEVKAKVKAKLINAKVKTKIKKIKEKVHAKPKVVHKTEKRHIIKRRHVAKGKAVSLHPKHIEKKRKTKVKRSENNRKRYKTKKKLVRKKIIAKPKKGPNFDQLIAKKIKQIQRQLEEKKKQAYLDQQLKQLENKVAKRAQERFNQALRNYLAKYVYPQVHGNWAWPEQLSKQRQLECIVVIRIDASGHIIKYWVEKASKNRLFDQSVLRAVEESGPFPPLPPALRPGPLEIGIRFKPDQIGNE